MTKTCLEVFSLVIDARVWNFEFSVIVIVCYLGFVIWNFNCWVGQDFCIKIEVILSGITFLAEKEEFLLCQRTDPTAYEF
jgi:hypothetical protein